VTLPVGRAIVSVKVSGAVRSRSRAFVVIREKTGLGSKTAANAFPIARQKLYMIARLRYALSDIPSRHADSPTGFRDFRE